MDEGKKEAGPGANNQNKDLLRQVILEKRRALSDHERSEKSQAIQRRFLGTEEFSRGKVIHLFLSFRGEVITDGIVREALKRSKRIIVPVVDPEAKGLILSEIKSYPEEVGAGAFGIPEPRKEFIRKVSPALVDVFVLPGVAFDLKGHRIGYGAGYYDRILGRNSSSRLSEGVSLMGLAFELQLVDHIPSVIHDVRVHKIVTEERIIDCLV